MKLKITLFLFLTGILSTSIQSQDLWTLETADNLNEAQYRYGLFQSSRIGLNDKFEVSSRLLNNIFSQNIAGKIQWYGKEILVATRHSLHYPKLGAIALQRSGFKAWISDSAVIPQPLLLKNELLVSRYFKFCKCCPDVYLATVKLGLLTNLLENKDTFPAINHPILHHRTQTFNNYYLWNLGGNFQGPMPKVDWLNFYVDANYYRIFSQKEWAIEHKAMASFKILFNSSYSEYLEFFFGYKITYNNSSLTKNFMMFPLIDIVYRFDEILDPKNGLFQKKVNKKVLHRKWKVNKKDAIAR